MTVNELDPLKLHDAMQKYTWLGRRGLVSNHKLTVINFSIPSYKPRMWVYSILNGNPKPILDEGGYLVAHGKNSGGVIPDHFSNKVGSLMSSLGAYTTGETYIGKYGVTLKLDGQEATNSNARLRSVVMHGSNYVSEKYIQQTGAIGRSWGCPAVDFKYKDLIVNTIKDHSVLVILK